jgi:uncharacterized membrane protein
MTAIGPVEYVLIGFPGNQFTGGIAPAIADLVASGTVRIIDLVFIKKDADGNVVSFEYDELGDTAEYGAIDGDADGFLDDEDILDAADALDPESSALLIVWEDLWAERLGQEIVASGGELLAGGRIPHRVVTEVLEAIERSES